MHIWIMEKKMKTEVTQKNLHHHQTISSFKTLTNITYRYNMAHMQWTILEEDIKHGTI